MNQQLEIGDLVEVGTLSSFQRHFEQNCLAIVSQCYCRQFGGRHPCGTRELVILGKNGPYRVAWYDDKDLTLIKRGFARPSEWARHWAAFAGGSSPRQFVVNP